jgi:hypothetical protein
LNQVVPKIIGLQMVVTRTKADSKLLPYLRQGLQRLRFGGFITRPQ